MRRSLLSLTLMGAMLLACTGVVLAQTTTPSNQQSAQAPSHGTLPSPGQAVRACPGPPGRGEALCHALVRTDVQQSDNANGGGTAGEETTGPSTTQSNKGETNAGKNKPTSSVTNPAGYHPADLQAAYNVAKEAANNGGGATVAIVDAYNDPNAESDLGVYRSTFGLPACTTSNGCFQKVNQDGVQGSYPRNNGGWAQEISLDLDMVSAVCPNCKILLVEANSNSFANLAAAVDYAASVPGVVAISNSYGGSEYSNEVKDESHFNHPGIAVTVSSGDSGYGVEFPAASQWVTAVGGTSLKQDSSSRGWSEKVWSGAGSGCSAYITKPSWQTDTGCSKRTVADVGAVANPNTGVAVYDSYSYQGRKGWLVFGGTSVASPIIASVYALAGNYSSINDGSYPYNNTSSLYDVTSGSNGSCVGTYLCTGEAGYDGPTGNGTPNGTGGF
jgi:subtilase family serine protease